LELSWVLGFPDDVGVAGIVAPPLPQLRGHGRRNRPKGLRRLGPLVRRAILLGFRKAMVVIPATTGLAGRVLGFLFEVAADQSKDAFMANPSNKGKVRGQQVQQAGPPDVSNCTLTA
jgi:hypothetical protein